MADHDLKVLCNHVLWHPHGGGSAYLVEEAMKDAEGSYGCGFIGREVTAPTGHGAGLGGAPFLPTGGERLFIKVFKRNTKPDSVARELAEARRHRSLRQHPHVVRVQDAVEAANVYRLDGTLVAGIPPVSCVVQELCAGGTLFNRVVFAHNPAKPGICARRPLPEDLARVLFAQLVAGVNHMHANKIYHRDIKPDNIMLTECMSVAKLCDFGHNKRVVPRADEPLLLAAQTLGVGTTGYNPPDVLVHKLGDPKYNPAAWDVWALGQTLLFMLAADLMPIVPRDYDVYGRVLSRRLRMPIEELRDVSLLEDCPDGTNAAFAPPEHPLLWEKYAAMKARLSPDARSLLNLMMHPDFRYRISLGQILDHQWFAQRPRTLAPLRELQLRLHEEMLGRAGAAAKGVALSDAAPLIGGFSDVGGLAATASGGNAGYAGPERELPDDAAFVAATYVIDCRTAIVAPAATRTFDAAAVYCAASQKLAALGLEQPMEARDHRTLRLRMDGLAGASSSATAQVVAVDGRLFMHLQLLPPNDTTAAAARSVRKRSRSGASEEPSGTTASGGGGGSAATPARSRAQVVSPGSAKTPGSGARRASGGPGVPTTLADVAAVLQELFAEEAARRAEDEQARITEASASTTVAVDYEEMEASLVPS